MTLQSYFTSPTRRPSCCRSCTISASLYSTKVRDAPEGVIIDRMTRRLSTTWAAVQTKVMVSLSHLRVTRLPEPWALPDLMVALTCCKSSGTPAEAMPLNATRKTKLRLSTKLRHFIAATPRVKRISHFLAQVCRPIAGVFVH